MMTLSQRIEAARNEVRKHAFGTEAYDAAFEAMHVLTAAAADEHARTHAYNSIDGDIFAPRGRR